MRAHALPLVISGALIVALLAATAGAAAPAPAPQPDARGGNTDAHVQQAREHALAGRHELAIEELRAAYELEPRPELLLGMARSYRQLGRKTEATYFYDRFLTVSQPGPLRDAAGEELRLVGQTQPRLAAASPQDAGVSASARTASPAARPLWRRWWVWAGTAVLAGAITACLLLGDRDPTAVPATDLGNRRFFP